LMTGGIGFAFTRQRSLVRSQYRPRRETPGRRGFPLFQRRVHSLHRPTHPHRLPNTRPAHSSNCGGNPTSPRCEYKVQGRPAIYPAGPKGGGGGETMRFVWMRERAAERRGRGVLVTHTREGFMGHVRRISLALAALVVVLVVLPARPADAWVPNGCKYPGTNPAIGYRYYSLTSVWQTAQVRAHGTPRARQATSSAHLWTPHRTSKSRTTQRLLPGRG
jgi:hypothetical protein